MFDDDTFDDSDSPDLHGDDSPEDAPDDVDVEGVAI